MKTSAKWTLNWADLKRIGRNALIFFAPVLIIEFTLVEQKVTDPRLYTIAFGQWVIGVVLDTLRKLQAS